MRQKQKLDAIKVAYIRERKWKEDELMWREQCQREQMELQLRKVKAMELKMKEAKRDDELAGWRAEAAAFKKHELQAQHDLEKQQRKVLKEGKANHTSDSSMELEEGWTELRDAYGNVYYYNETTLESVWDRPVKKNVPAAKGEASPTKAESTKSTIAKGSSTESSSPSIGSEDTATSSRKDGQGQNDAVPEGNCWKCRTAVATKECLDCHDPLQRQYCMPCFLLEHHTFPDNTGAKQRHDFRVLIKAKQQSRCLSLACKAKKDDANLATYYCDACPTIVSPTIPVFDSEVQAPLSRDLTTATPVQAAAKGCFFCEECFPVVHESAQAAAHIASASLHFRTGAILCCDCSARVGTRLCEQCDEEFCIQCFDRIHLQSQKKHDHVWSPIEILKDELTSAKDSHCIECDRRKCTRLCNLCGDGFCDSCFLATHDKGKKQQHTWIAWESFAQVGDWLEIFDEKTNATIFFNIETKESTTKQPFVLKSGTERHQLQFHEREQLQKRKELESEIVQLKEKLHEMQEREALAQRPQSRNLRSSGAARADGKPDAAPDTSASEKPIKKRGLFGKLFSRRQKGNKAILDDGLTPEERKRQELMKSISSCRPHGWSRPDALSEPRPSQLDICCRHGIPLRPPDPQPSSEMMGLAFAASDYHVQRGDRMKGSPSRASSLVSFQMRRKLGASPPASPRTSASFNTSANAFTSSSSSEVHAPGVVFSTAPRVSPRKAMALLKTATRMSASAMAPASRLASKTADQDPCTEEMKQESLTNAASADDDASSTSPSLERDSVNRKRRTRQQDAGGNEFTTAPWYSHDELENDGDDGGDGLDPFIEKNTPIQVEFVIQRSNHHSHSNDSSSHANLSFLPPLSPTAARDRRPSRTPSMVGNENEHGLLGGVCRDADTGRLSRCGGGERMGDEDTDDNQFQENPLNLHHHLQSMVLAPGVRLQTGIETKNGPDLPVFPTRMRKVTFYSLIMLICVARRRDREDTIDARAPYNFVGLGFQHQSGILWPPPASSRRMSKVQRPCTTPGGGHISSCSTGGSSRGMVIDQTPNASFANWNGSQTNRAEDFKELAKQRAFIRRKPSFSFATSSFKKRTVRDKDQHQPHPTRHMTPPTSRKKCILSISNVVDLPQLTTTHRPVYWLAIFASAGVTELVCENKPN
ncbi:Protein abnormal spindle, partial [Globisporangium splendens]